MGFNEDAVYAHDYQSNQFYALNPSDGSIKWVSNELSYTFGPMDGVFYTCERNLVINGDLGSVDKSTICLDRETGELLWSNANWISITPNESKASWGDHLYLIVGAINQPKQLAAVDMRTGETLFLSEELPGDADQEGPIAVSHEGTVYFRRDGGDFYAVADRGDSFEILWTYTPVDMGLFVMNFAVDHQGDPLLMDHDKIYRLDKNTGIRIDSTIAIGIDAGRIAVGGDSTVYANNTNGSYYAFAHSLQNLLWQINISGNYYAGPALSRNGIMVMAGSGNAIRAYQHAGDHRPVADFYASSYVICDGEMIDFFDQSSFIPANWHWEFPGGSPSTSNDPNPQGIIYQLPGIYEVSLVVTNSLGSDTLVKSCMIDVRLCESVPELQVNGGLKVSPNPASGLISITGKEAAGIRIFNAAGQMVYRDELRSSTRTLDAGNFPPGLYLVVNTKGETAKLLVR
jgi:outer membrane protein assembly factor BamB